MVAADRGHYPFSWEYMCNNGPLLNLVSLPALYIHLCIDIYIYIVQVCIYVYVHIYIYMYVYV